LTFTNLYDKVLYNIMLRRNAMDEEVNTKRIRQRVLLQYFDDGLWDINIGITLLLLGVGMLIDALYLAGIWPALGSVMVIKAKEHYTYPRLGYVKFMNSIKHGRMGIIASVLLLGVLIAIFTLMNQHLPLIEWIRMNFDLVLALVIGGAILAIAILLNITRVYVYSALVIFTLVFSRWIGSIGINLMLTGGLIILIGIYLLASFVHRYPVQKYFTED